MYIAFADSSYPSGKKAANLGNNSQGVDYILNLGLGDSFAVPAYRLGNAAQDYGNEAGNGKRIFHKVLLGREPRP